MVDLYKNIRIARFRGIVFDTLEDNTNFGRRIQTHEFPAKDTPMHEDSGLSVQSFNFTAIIGGADYYNRATQFENALKKSGAGKLVHPYYGEMDVIVKRASRQHSSSRVGEVTFRVEFEKYGEAIYPQAIADSAANITVASDAFFVDIAGDFIARFKSVGVPDFITNDAVTRLDDFTNNVKEIIGFSPFQPVISWTESWQSGSNSALIASIVDLYDTIARSVSFIETPLIGSVATVKNAQPSDIINLVKSLTSASDYSVALTDSSESQSQAIRSQNASVLDLAQRSSALSAAGKIIRSARYESQEQAISIRDLFAGKMDVLLNDLGNAGLDASWSSGRGLAVAVSRDINVRIGRLPRTIHVKNTYLRPAINLANRLYGDNPSLLFDRAEDITNRNSIRHASFVPAVELEVLV